MRVSIVVPTYNESGNLEELVSRVDAALSAARVDYEVVVVDDASPDGTGELAERLAQEYPVSVIHRSGKLGLSSAVIEGFAKASGDIVGVMDADLSHPPQTLPKVLAPLLAGSADLVVGSRYVEGGAIAGWPLLRRMTSRGAVLLARPLTPVKDCVSGYFFFRRQVIEGVKLKARGYKIGLDVLVRGRYNKVVEVPFTFSDRAKGKSKLSPGEYAKYLRHLASLYFYRLTSSSPRR